MNDLSDQLQKLRAITFLTQLQKEKENKTYPQMFHKHTFH